VSILTPREAQEAFDEAQTIVAVECPQVNFAAIEGTGDAFDAGVWYGIAGCLTVLERHGLLKDAA
jgi:hypothetical protein